MSDKPWELNRKGICALCGYPFGHYDSKYIERAEPHRMVCIWGPPDGCAHADLGDLDERLWYYWTDG